MNLFDKYHITFQSINYSFFKKFSNPLVFIVDKKLLSLYPELQQLKPLISIVATEKNKSLKTLDKIFHFFYLHKVDKSFTVVCIGGGIVCDIGALAASLWHRGISFILIPTTLLSMTDAAIGGKTAVNFNQQKNLIGTIALPQQIIIDLKFLTTLHPIEIQQGMAEIIKHALIADKQLAETLFLTNQINQNILEQSIFCKLAIIDKDLKENGIRKLLNAGHTIGHALELTYHLKHGIAVATGLYYETEIFYKMGICNVTTLTYLKQLLTRHISLFTNFDKETIKQNIFYDKKKRQEQIILPVIKEIGNASLFTINIDEFLKQL